MPRSAQPQEQAAAGKVRARFFYKTIVPGNKYADLRLVILRGGIVRLDQRVPPWPGRANYGVQPGGYGAHRTLTVRDLDGDGEPEVSLLLYWGGAHCCSWSRVYRFVPSAKTYKVSLHFWADDSDPTFRDLNRDGKPEIVSADTRLAGGPFASYASTYFPIQIWSYRGGHFINVTRRFPAQIKADATRALASFNRSDNTDPRGAAAGWAADQALLGHAKRARARLDKWAQAGELRDRSGGFAVAPTGTAFVTALWKYLHRLGYV
jgi:hypothetical protein